MVENYHPLNWAHLCKPVFDLAGPEIDSKLLRLFFEDKGKRKIARKFELLDKKVSETEFIEILSSAELLDVEGYEDEQQQLFSRVSEVDMPREKEKAAEPEKDEPKGGKEQFFEEEDSDEIEAKIKTEADFETETESELEPEEVPAGEVDVIEDIDTETEKMVENDDISEPEDFSVENDIKPDIDGESENALEEESEDEQKNIANLFSEMKKAQDDEDFTSEESEEADISLIEKSDGLDIDDEHTPLLNKFMFDEGGTGESYDEESENPEEGPSSIYEEMNLVRESESKEKQAEEMFDENEIEEDTDEKKSPEEMSEELSYQIENEETSELENDAEDLSTKNEAEYEALEDEENEDLPMWRSFLERDDLETESGYEYEEELSENDFEEGDDLEDEIEEEEGFIEEPIYDLTTSEPDPEEKIEEVSKWLDDEKERFVVEIFGGSEIAYEQAVLEIMDFDDWKHASRYLEREVFARNRVEVYDEAAVDFTDRLHSYFMQK